MKKMASATTQFHSPFLQCPLKPSSSPFSRKSLIKIDKSSKTSYPCVRAIDLDQNTILAIGVGVTSVAIGIGIPVFYETQIDSASKRDNTQPCFPCNGSGALGYIKLDKTSINLRVRDAAAQFLYNATRPTLNIVSLTMEGLKVDGGQKLKYVMLTKKCRFCLGTGSVTVDLGGGEKEVSNCINCDTAGTLTCTTCQGSGIQPRYLDRREFKDDD